MASTDITLIIQAVDKATSALTNITQRLEALEKSQAHVAATAKTMAAAQEKAATATAAASIRTEKSTESLKQFAIKGAAVVSILKRIGSASSEVSTITGAALDALGVGLDKALGAIGAKGLGAKMEAAVKFEQAMRSADALGKLWERLDDQLQTATGEERKRLEIVTGEIGEQYDALQDLGKAYATLGESASFETLVAAAKALTAARKGEAAAADELAKANARLASEQALLAQSGAEEETSAVERANTARAELARIQSAIDKAMRPTATTTATEREALNEMAVALRQEIEALEMLHDIELLIGTSSTPAMERALESARKTLNENAEAARNNAHVYSDLAAAAKDVPEEIKIEIKTKGEKELERALITVGELGDRIGSGFADAFMSIIDGSKSAADAFRQMAASILSDVARMLISRSISNLIVQSFGGGNPATKAFQHGGHVIAGAPVLVGERGPELFVPGQSGYVNNTSASRGGGSTVVNFNISAVDGPSVQAMLMREADTLKAVIASAARRDHRFRAAMS